MVTYNNATNNYATSRIIVSSTPGLGNYTTIQAAINAATSDSVIFILPGTYTEDLTLKSGANLEAFAGVGTYADANVIIVGKHIDNGVALVCSFSNIQFVTNSDYVFSLTADSSLQFIDCNFRITNHNGFAMNSAFANMFLYGCTATITSNGISLWSIASGSLWIYSMQVINEATTTPSSQTGGGIYLNSFKGDMPISASGGGLTISYSDINTSVRNSVCVALTGTAQAYISYTLLNSGTASCVTVGAGATLNYDYLKLTSSNTYQIG